jgi:hypothetical protein
MTTREMLIRLAVAALLLVAIGAVGNRRTNEGYLPPKPPHFQRLPRFQIDWLHHQWVRFCAPFPSEICA